MLERVELTNFRNLNKRKFEFSDNITIVVGPNASGKTNLLESIYLLATGKSFKAKVEEEMINYDSDIARVIGKSSVKLEVVLTRGLIDIGGERPQKVARKKLLVNGISKRLIDFSGNFRVVVFAPHDLELVTESPSVRRKFLDSVLSQVDREYRRAVLSYEKGLRQRNRLLWHIKENPSLGRERSRLLFWDKLLIKNGDYISSSREKFVNFVNDQPPVNEEKFSLEYDKSAISEARLEQYTNEEIAAATTLVGPHRDDFIFKISKKVRSLDRYGSRGEQRMGVLWLKLAEMAYILERTGDNPTLLLDDIFSELDHKHRDVVMDIVGKQQTIITTADPHFVEEFKSVKKIDIKS